MHVTFNIINLIIMKRFNLTDKVIEQFKVYFEDSCNINRVGNGITMVTSDMAGIVYNLYGDAMLGIGKGGGWPSLLFAFAFNPFCRPANPGLFYL